MPFLSSGGGGCYLSVRAVEFTGVTERDDINPGTVDLRMKENWNNTQGQTPGRHVLYNCAHTKIIGTLNNIH